MRRIPSSPEPLRHLQLISAIEHLSMANRSLADHIMAFPNALGEERCRLLIERFESSAEKQVNERESGHRFVQLDVTQHWPDQSKLLMHLFFDFLCKYQLSVKAAFWPPKFSFEHLRIKRYLPNGRESFPVHVDVMSHVAARRFMTAIIYLNSGTGGETVFPNLDVSIEPTAGKLIAFPVNWMFPHAGLPPLSTPKYILHTYLCYPDSTASQDSRLDKDLPGYSP
jgi:prolyl 4-hydroxylase